MFAKLHSTNGGVSDTALNELTVSPIRSPCALRAVTMVTPVANMDNAARKSTDEKEGERGKSKEGLDTGKSNRGEAGDYRPGRHIVQDDCQVANRLDHLGLFLHG